MEENMIPLPDTYYSICFCCLFVLKFLLLLLFNYTVFISWFIKSVFSKIMTLGVNCISTYEFYMFLRKILSTFSKLVALGQVKIIPPVLEGILCTNKRDFKYKL